MTSTVLLVERTAEALPIVVGRLLTFLLFLFVYLFIMT
jgi:hypothetical protein